MLAFLAHGNSPCSLNLATDARLRCSSFARKGSALSTNLSWPLQSADKAPLCLTSVLHKEAKQNISIKKLSMDRPILSETVDLADDFS
jgi:hypothetical protein